jgi:hypothetical protein
VDDEDLGDVIIYTGEGGRDSTTGRQVADQQLTLGIEHWPRIAVGLIRCYKRAGSEIPPLLAETTKSSIVLAS